MSREQQKSDFLAKFGWKNAQISHLAGDASARRYERLHQENTNAVLMDAPKGCGDDIGDFLRIGNHLSAMGLSTPQTIAVDEEAGFLLQEDLGDAIYTDIVTRRPHGTKTEALLYTEAAKVLLHLQSQPAPANLPDLTAEDWAASALFAPEWYSRAVLGHMPDGQAFHLALLQALKAYADGPRVLILRDYHAGNLLWLPQRKGLARVGLLDFQLGQMGQPAYDLVSLLQDARRDVAPDTQAYVLEIFAQNSGQKAEDFHAAYATLGALRALRIMGIFARLCILSGKDQYLQHLPRVYAQVYQNLSHPALRPLREICEKILPPPTAQAIERIKALCGKKTFP